VKSPWVPVTFGHCFLFFLIFYSLFFTALDALPLPCPALASALALPCPVSNFPFAARDRRRKLHRERAVFVFPFAARDKRRKLHRERAVFVFPFAARDRRRKLHRERAVFFFPFAARDRRRKLHPAHRLFFFFFPRGRFCAFGFRDNWRWSQVRRFACGRDG